MGLPSSAPPPNPDGLRNLAQLTGHHPALPRSQLVSMAHSDLSNPICWLDLHLAHLWLFSLSRPKESEESSSLKKSLKTTSWLSRSSPPT